MLLTKIITALRTEPIKVTGPAHCDVVAVTHDSRKVGAGTLFVALTSVTPGRSGEAAKGGERYILEAVERGAVAVITSSDIAVPRATMIRVHDPREALADVAAVFYGNPSLQLQTVGITGTNGKTTTAFLIKHLLDVADRPCGLIGTVRYILGPRELPADRTTPESSDTQSMLREMRDVSCRAAVMEVSSHALELQRVRRIEFDAAVYTNLTQDHLDYHETMDRYFSAKQKLFEHIACQEKKRGVAVINIDDRYGRRLLDNFGQKLRTVTYGQAVGAMFRATDLQITMRGTQYSLYVGDKSYLVRLPFFGTFNVYNSLAALATMHALGHDVRKSVAALKNAPQVPGRLEMVDGPSSFRVFVDYAHTPDALENVLQTIRSLSPERVITVFGCGGDRDRAKRRPMGAVVEKHSNWSIITSDNPRSEDAEAICRDISSGMQGDQYEVILDRRAAIRRAVIIAQPGDIVLIAGKGHETLQEIGGRKVPFDDVAEAESAIRGRVV